MSMQPLPPDAARELAELRALFGRAVIYFPTHCLTAMMAAAKRGDGREAHAWRERAAEWRAISQRVRELSGRRLAPCDVPMLLAALREAKGMADRWMPGGAA